MRTLGIIQSVCPTCHAPVPAKVVSDGQDVRFRHFCPEHGESEFVVSGDVADYLVAQRYIRPAWVPLAFSGDDAADCPEGCGFCARHEQHLCLPIVEITSRCNLACPICLVDAGDDWAMGVEEFNGLLDRLITAERQIDVLNISGGEPLIHPDLLPLVDTALARPQIVRVSISTNGLALLSDPTLVSELRQRNVGVCLQFDGFQESAYQVLRGAPLLRQKLDILSLLEDEGISTSLTMTAAAGVNDDQFPRMLDYLFAHEHAVSLMVQPLALAGRAEGLPDSLRLSIPDVVRALGSAGHPAVAAADFVPLPCSHPLCFSLAFYLVLDDGRPLSVNRLVDASQLLDAVANRVFFGIDAADQHRLKRMVDTLWSGPAASTPDSAAALRAIRGILRQISGGPFNARKAFDAAERRIKSIFIHAFQDAATFDLARVRRCCNAYPQPDGRLVPACVCNVMGRTR